MSPAARRGLFLGAIVLTAFAVAYRWRILRSRQPRSGVVNVELVNKKRQEVHVPRATEPLTIDGELSEPAWHAPVATKFLRPDGTESRPYNDVRFLWSSDGMLHVALYASDINIVTAAADAGIGSADAFHLVFFPPEGVGAEHSFWVGPTGNDKSPAAVSEDGVETSTVHGAIDMDEGTVNDAGDKDEEWVVELEIPLASLGLKPVAGQRIDMVATRCDVDTRGGAPLESPCPETNRLALVLDP